MPPVTSDGTTVLFVKKNWSHSTGLSSWDGSSVTALGTNPWWASAGCSALTDPSTIPRSPEASQTREKVCQPLDLKLQSTSGS